MEEDNTQINSSIKENETPSEVPLTGNNHIELQNNNNNENNSDLSKEREQMEDNSPSNPLKRGRNEFQRGRENKDYKKDQYWRNNNNNNNPRGNRGHSPPMKIPKREHWPTRGYYNDKGGEYWRGNNFQDRHTPNRNSPNIPPRGGERGGDRRGNKTFDGPLKSLKQFSIDLEIDNNVNNKEIIEKKYEEYRVEWQRTQTVQFFEDHKNDEWLKEKYHPNYLIEKFKRKNENCEKLISEFDKEIKSQEKSKWCLDYRDLNEMDIEKSQEENKNIENNNQTSVNNQQNNDYSVVVIKNIPSNITRENIKELLASVEGCSGQKIFFSEPNKQKHFTRSAFVKFDDEIQNEKAKNFLFSKRIGSFEVITSIEKLSQPWKVKTTPSICSSDQRISVDLNQSTNIINILNNEVNITNFSDVMKDNDLLNSLSEKEKLDLNIYYLRKVHHYCYYCATEFDDEFELYQKCASIHLRRKHGETIDPDFENGWIAKLDKTFAERENYFPTVTLKGLEEKIVNSKVNEEDAEKSRCVLCKKLFRANEFVVKHLYLKHQDVLDEEKEKAINQQYLENYQNDPHKIIVYSHQRRRADSFSPYKNSPNWRANTPNYNYKDGKKQMSPYQNNNAKIETRELRSYVDLDTPGEFIPEIDYSTSL